MTKCLCCGIEVKTQRQWWEEKCKKAITPGASHMIRKNELQKLNKSRE